MKMVRLGLCLWLVMMGAWVQAAPSDEPADNQLDNVRQAISATQKNLSDKQAAQKRAQQTLSNSKSALEAAQRELVRLNRQQEVSWQKLKALQGTLTQLQADIASTKAQIARLLSGNYRNRQPNAVVLFLKNADANQKSRFLMYTRRINQANDQVVQKLAAQQTQLATQEAAINAELAKLQRLTSEQQQKLQRLGQNNSRISASSRQLNQEIANHRAQLSRLRQEEQGLNNVIAGIRAQQGEQKRAQVAQQTQIAQQRAENASHDAGNLTNEDKGLQPSSEANSDNHARVSQQQGSLPMPVAGRVAGTYGSKRETGGTWRGLFIATAPAAVHSIAAGRVSYAAALSGYGNTVIIDHGDGYMSVYTGLSQIWIGAGANVSARQNIGTSGTLPAGEQGLYFELRYRNQTINPRSWVR